MDAHCAASAKPAASTSFPGAPLSRPPGKFAQGQTAQLRRRVAPGLLPPPRAARRRDVELEARCSPSGGTGAQRPQLPAARGRRRR
eukprot:11200529-Lingulodinium_polyedra.AAC.1